jgi:starch-binding outer membrane protein, SusD/RagB family
MKNIKVLLILVMLGALGSCSQYLDIVPDNVATIENAFSMRTTAEKYLFTCYSYLPEEGNPRNNPAFTAGDEFWFHYPSTMPGWPVARNEQSVVDPEVNYWDGSKGGQALFQGIRDCNIFLENVGKVPDLDEEERKRWIAEVKFLKAYYHFYLLRLYGPIPLIRQNLPISAGVEEVQVTRRPVEEGVDYIVELLDEATAELPAEIVNPVADAGRITKSIALALKARVLVLAASPLFNGNSDYNGFANKDGTPLINAQYNAEKWARAAEACKQAIEQAHQAGHQLYYYSQSAVQYNVSDITKTKLNIRNSFTEKWNRELIWANTNSMATSIQADAFPRGLDPTKTANGGVRGILAPTQKMAELFYTKNGVPITEDKTWNYENRFDLKTTTEEHKYNLKPFYQLAALHFDREPRFYADLGFDGAAWFGSGKTSDEAPWYMEAKKGQPQSMIAIHSYSVTGYWPKKLVHLNSSLGSGNTFSYTAYAWPMIRLADLYLMYAEALNEVNGPNADVYHYVNQIRTRAGLPSVEEAWSNFSTQPNKYTSREGMREIIQQERLIELAFEGQRYWDLRRWKKAVQVISGPVKGWDIDQADAATYYRERVLFNQKFTSRDYLWPLRELNLVVNKNLVQNPGW